MDKFEEINRELVESRRRTELLLVLLARPFSKEGIVIKGNDDGELDRKIALLLMDPAMRTLEASATFEEVRKICAQVSLRVAKTREVVREEY